MRKGVIEIILGLLCGIFLGITGIAPTGVILILLDFLQIGDYKSNLGTILFLYLFPLSIGSVYKFYKSNKINFSLGGILLFTTIVGSYISSTFVVGNKNQLSTKTIKYITSCLGFFIGIVFLLSGYYEKN